MSKIDYSDIPEITDFTKAVRYIEVKQATEDHGISIKEAYEIVLAKSKSNSNLKAKAKAGLLTVDDFTTLKIDTRGFKFDREEANVRR